MCVDKRAQDKAGQIAELTQCLLLDVWRFLEALDVRGKSFLRVAVNLSSGMIHQEFLSWLCAEVARRGFGSRLEFEITETIIMKMTEETSLEFQRLKGLGSQFAIDDFGTGYSNLGYLQNFEANVLKIDKRFIDGIPLEEKNTKLVLTIIQMAKSFGMKVFAEGVEYSEQYRFLREIGCDTIQGYYFAKPMPIDAALSWGPDAASATQSKA